MTEPDNVDSLGYRPVLKHVLDYPAEDEPPINIITDIPMGVIRPMGFASGQRRELDKVIAAVRRNFKGKPLVVKEWEEFNDLMPKSDDVYEYLASEENSMSTDAWMNHVYMQHADDENDPALQRALKNPTLVRFCHQFYLPI